MVNVYAALATNRTIVLFDFKCIFIYKAFCYTVLHSDLKRVLGILMKKNYHGNHFSANYGHHTKEFQHGRTNNLPDMRRQHFFKAKPETEGLFINSAFTGLALVVSMQVVNGRR